MAEKTQGTDSGAPPPRWIMKIVTRVHVAIYRLTGGRMGNTLSGDDVCFVTMTGAKSGRILTVPLMYVPHGDNVLLVASMGGAPKNPVWYYNIAKNPDVEIEHRGKSRKMRARIASSEEKPDLWPVCDSFYAPFADYRQRTSRDIPVFVCEPA